MITLLNKHRYFFPTDSNLEYLLENCSNITIREAIPDASQLKADLKISFSTVIDINNGQILNSAASILRKGIGTLQILYRRISNFC